MSDPFNDPIILTIPPLHHALIAGLLAILGGVIWYRAAKDSQNLWMRVTIRLVAILFMPVMLFSYTAEALLYEFLVWQQSWSG